MGAQIINCIHNDPGGCIIVGIIFLVGVWTTAIIRIVKNNKRAKECKRKNNRVGEIDKTD